MTCEEMIRDQIVSRGVTNPLVLSAMLRVPRERFVPENTRMSAYSDTPLPIGSGQTISQPYIVALMTELLCPDIDSDILEIGTGSGYQAAVLSRIVRKVHTVEIIPQLAEKAQRLFDELGYTNISVKSADGSDGWCEFAPYDGIIVTAATPIVPEELKKQLKAGGIMVVPVGEANWVQSLEVIIRTADGFEQTSNISVRFVPMTGRAAGLK